MMEKYRVQEVAKDLNMPSKEVLELLGQHFSAYIQDMTALEEPQLNVIFEQLYQKRHGGQL
jgi:translation initiation factor IF-2